MNFIQFKRAMVEAKIATLQQFDKEVLSKHLERKDLSVDTKSIILDIQIDLLKEIKNSLKHIEK